MRHKIVPGSAITARSLRATDYVLCPRTEAARILDAWMDDTGTRGLFDMRGLAMRDLREKIEAALTSALKENQCTE